MQPLTVTTYFLGGDRDLVFFGGDFDFDPCLLDDATVLFLTGDCDLL